jgi:hypothetical protein
MQRKLTDTEIAMAKTAQESLGNGFFWESTPDGRDYWHGVSGRLLRMVKHGTNDGKPWVEPEHVVGETEHGRLRDLAIDAAVHRLIMANHPTLTQIEIQRRCRIDSMRGHGYYTVFFDDKPVATVSLSIESPRRFTIELPKGDKP